MAKVRPFHSIAASDRKVHHDNDQRTEGNDIEAENKRVGFPPGAASQARSDGLEGSALRLLAAAMVMNRRLFNVEHIDATSRSSVLGADLDLAQAIDLAKREARKRRVGRMFLAGSADVRNVIVITERAA